MTFLDDKGISVMNWLAKSPDLIPIGHTWNIIYRRIRQWLHYSENVQTLNEALVQKVQMIPEKSIRSMAHRCQESVDNRGGGGGGGGHTSYW